MSILLNSGLAPGLSPAAIRSGLSRLAEVRTGRKGPYNRKGEGWDRLEQAVREYRENNPDAQRLVRRYRLRFDDPVERDGADSDSFWHKTIITFGRFGCPDAWLNIGNHKVEPSSLLFHAPTKTCDFETTVAVPVDGRIQDVTVSGSFCFDSLVPTGILHVNEAAYEANLEPEPAIFDAEVSDDAGASWSDSDKKLTWDATTTKWKNATWDSSVKYAYKTVKETDDDVDGADTATIENYFTDKSSSPATEMKLCKDDDFTCTLADVSGTTIMVTNVTDPKDAPESRAKLTVKSGFPKIFTVAFSSLGDSFEGAYRDKNDNVYAIKGTIIDDLDDDEDSSAQSLVSALASEAMERPFENMFAFLDGSLSYSSQRKAEADTKLQLSAISSNNPMVADSKDPSRYVDAVAQAAMRDFYDIMLYYMDEDLRKLFISASPPTLTSEIKSIAESDRVKNAAFYKRLQVPYLTSMLANSTLDEGHKCNGARAEMLLKVIPADDLIYQSQSAALYRYRYLEKFPATKKFLKDQRDKDYSAEMDKITKKRKKVLDDTAKDMKSTNPDFEKDLKKVKEDMDKLGSWAKERKLYWAYLLLYVTEKATIKMLYAQYTTGSLSATIAMKLKGLNALFGVLENNQVNTAEGATNFMGAFQEQMRLFQMSSLIPQLVDIDGSASDFDSLVKACLETFWHKYENSDNTHLKEQAALAKTLAQDDTLRNKFLNLLKKAVRLGGASCSWTITMEMWDTLVVGTTWFKVLTYSTKLFALIAYAAGAALIMLPLVPGVWDTMTTADKVYWAGATAFATGIFILKAAQGLVRLKYLWKDISTWKDAFKCVAGYELAGNMAQPARQIPGTFARYFTRTAKQTANLAMLEAEVAASEKELFRFSRLSRIFGRNMGELLGSVLGTTLAIGSLVLTAIALAKETEPLLIAVDIFVLLSSAVQILAVSAGWLLASDIVVSASMVSALTLVAAWGGPIAIAFALVGCVILIVYALTHKPDNPLQDFIDKKVKPAGLYMEHLAIDYFNAVAATDKTASRVGVAVQGASAGAKGDPVSADEKVYLQLEVKDEGKTGSLKFAKDLDYTTAMVWSLRTDGYGQSQLYTVKYVKIKGSDGSTTTRPSLWYLSADDGGDGVCVRQVPSKSADKAKYDKQVKYTRWMIDVVADPDLDEKSKTPVHALCNIKYKSLGGTVKYLVLKSDVAKKTPTAFALVDDPETTSDKRYVDKWLVQSESLGPQPFRYSRNPWQLFTTDKDVRNPPIFDDPEAVSTGYKWTVSPALPAFLQLVTTSTVPADEGMIRSVEDKTLEVTAQKTYTVTCQLMVDGKAHGKQEAKVDIAVVKKEDATKSSD